jgi:predicted Zn-dependent protease
MKLRAFALTAASLGCTYFPLPCFAADNEINDVAAIGHRNVGCAKGMGNWYSLEKQVAWGKQISQQVDSQSKVINDPVVSEYINRLGQILYATPILRCRSRLKSLIRMM